MSNCSRLLALTLLFTLAACSGGDGNSRIDYEEVESQKALDVPPDLVAPENTGETELPSTSDSSSILPQFAGIHVARDGGDRWLVVDAPVEKLWPRLQSFWGTLGLKVKVDEPQLGIMETDWAENLADTPHDFFASMVKKLFKKAYSAATRDKYRLRLERHEGGGTELYLSHYGLMEVEMEKRDPLDSANIAWEIRPSDPELVNEVLNRLVIYLGGSQQAAEEVITAPATQPERAHIAGNALILDEGFSRSWRRTGIALDRLGVVVEDRNRSQGIYYVSEIDLLPKEEGKGWLGSLFSSDKETTEGPTKLMIQLRGDENETRLTVLGMDGAPRQDNVAEELLKRLYQELK